MEAVRFTFVAVVGALVDLCVAFALAHYVSAPLWLAAAAGFVLGALINYSAHELWTFQTGSRRMSLRRALRYMICTFFVLVTRVAVVAVLAAWIGERYALAVLLGGMGVSFVVNFALSKFFIFTPTQSRS